MLKRIGLPAIVLISIALTPPQRLEAADAPVASPAGLESVRLAQQGAAASEDGMATAVLDAALESAEREVLTASLEAEDWLTAASRWLDAQGVGSGLWVVAALAMVLALVLGLFFWRRKEAAPGRGKLPSADAVPRRRSDVPEPWIQVYLRKMLGTTRGSPPRVSWSEILWSWVGAFLGIGAVVLLNRLYFAGTDLTLVIGSLGASAVLAYGAPRSPLAQPRNLVGGHLISAVVGVAAWKLLQQDPVLAPALAVATAIALMHATKTLHPPGGATALIAVIGSKQIHDLGFFYCLVPATLSPLILLLVALLVNNIPQSRRYPENWY